MRVIDAPKPTYPTTNGKQSLKAVPVLDLIVNEDGTVKTVRLTRSSGITPYDKAIVQALRKWRYNEGKGCGEREATVTVNIDF